MLLLLDTHLLLWAAYEPGKLSDEARRLIVDPANTLVFSAASIWEVAIKSGLGRSDFAVDANVLRRALVDNGYVELAISAAHAASVSALPPIHHDPFDRILLAQARAEGITLLSSDGKVGQYGSPVRSV
ncbi:type II toxin-antitoxin system VapC family toxin [Tessaracoccus caeni]|uniref:type II toxin-antitoxin system VapC family toxin n=1 Tax=Tessaracoccus caeni TaxID=3031239 RepID=UPI0023DA1FF5|nr:type II toxin-antitoxin system VapC family toxin [Tessaracoccus caeni]MDF1488992.1 type II toxin-antitoxin system VapC family toxin [Tessaracoccus caeni]